VVAQAPSVTSLNCRAFLFRDAARLRWPASCEVVATGKQANSIAFLQVADETFDVGIDTRTGVNDLDYQIPFRFNGKIDNLTFNLGPTQLTAVEEMKVREATARARD